MDDVSAFVSSILWNFWTVLAGIMLGFEPVIRWFWPSYDTKAALIIAPEQRRKWARIMALVAFVIANYLAFHDAKEQTRQAMSFKDQVSGRHLLDDQKQRIREGLKLRPDENFDFQINSAQNCDECEQFAEELRDFFNSIPGWRASGSALFFSQDRPRRNVAIISRDQDRLAVVDKIARAFADGGIRLDKANEDTQPGTFVIVVGRKSR